MSSKTYKSINKCFKGFGKLSNKWWDAYWKRLKAVQCSLKRNFTWRRARRKTKYSGNYAYKPPGASYTAQGPKKQGALMKSLRYLPFVLSLCLFIFPLTGYRISPLKRLYSPFKGRDEKAVSSSGGLSVCPVSNPFQTTQLFVPTMKKQFVLDCFVYKQVWPKKGLL